MSLDCYSINPYYNNAWGNSWDIYSTRKNGFLPDYSISPSPEITARNFKPHIADAFYGRDFTYYSSPYDLVNQMGSFYIDPSYLSFTYRPVNRSIFGFLNNDVRGLTPHTRYVPSYTSSFGFLQATRTPTTIQRTTHSRSPYSVSGRKASTSVTSALDLARSQLGVRENGSSNNSAGVNKYRFGVADGTPWCASFVSWCFGAGQGSNNALTFGYNTSSQDIRRQAQGAGFYSSKNSGYTPKPGDLMILRYSDGSGHIGIIEKVKRDGTFTVIEGNSSNSVQRVSRSMATANLDGFVRMSDWTNQTCMA